MMEHFRQFESLNLNKLINCRRLKEEKDKKYEWNENKNW